MNSPVEGQFPELTRFRTAIWDLARSYLRNERPDYFDAVYAQSKMEGAASQLSEMKAQLEPLLVQGRPEWRKQFQRWHAILENLLDTQMNLNSLRLLGDEYVQGQPESAPGDVLGVWFDTHYGHWALQGKAALERWRTLCSCKALNDVCRKRDPQWFAIQGQLLKDTAKIESTFEKLRHDVGHGGGWASQALRARSGWEFTLSFNTSEKDFFEGFFESFADVGIRYKIVEKGTNSITELVERQSKVITDLII